MSTIAECLEHARQCEWYAARTNDEQDRKFLLRKAKEWTKLAIKKELEIGPLRGRLHKLLGRVVRNWVSPASSKYFSPKEHHRRRGTNQTYRGGATGPEVNN